MALHGTRLWPPSAPPWRRPASSSSSRTVAALGCGCGRTNNIEMSRPQKYCIFCNKRGVTKEHFWPKWCEALFPRNDTDGRVEVSFSRTGILGSYTAAPSVLNRPGRVITKKLRVVCAVCNNTWMSRIEEEAKPILETAFAGNAMTLDVSQQLSLTNWITLKIMVSEFSLIDNYCTSSAERLQFRNTRTIPANLEIWLGKCGEGRWRSAHFRQGATYGLVGALPEKIPPKNTQTVAIGFGNLFIFGAVQPTNLKLFNISSELEFLKRLWPMDAPALFWPPVEKLSALQADRISNALDDVQRSGRVSWRPWP